MPRPADADASDFNAAEDAAPVAPVLAAAAPVEDGTDVAGRWGGHRHHHHHSSGGYGGYGTGYNNYGSGYNTGYNNYGTGYNNYGTGLLGWREGQKEGTVAAAPAPADAAAASPITVVPAVPLPVAAPVAATTNSKDGQLTFE